MFKLKNGDVAPKIALTDARGQEWRLSDHGGKMVILHFCRGEF
jgi:peroxiredoxin